MSRQKSGGNLETRLMLMLDKAVETFQEHPVKSTIVAFIVVWVIKKLIEAVRG